ncbi:MAG TPA: hypothetical protein PLR44_04095 [Thermomicrobiales bacterium]|nr:hypothetical protein [Thermomicrobiales bacterium]
MTRDTEHEDLPEAVVAAIVALLASVNGRDDEPVEASDWARSGLVAPTWRGDAEWGR